MYPIRRLVVSVNGDKQPDLVWQNPTTGERRLWLLVGTTKIGDIDLGTATTAGCDP